MRRDEILVLKLYDVDEHLNIARMRTREALDETTMPTSVAFYLMQTLGLIGAAMELLASTRAEMIRQEDNG